MNRLTLNITTIAHFKDSFVSCKFPLALKTLLLTPWSSAPILGLAWRTSLQVLQSRRYIKCLEKRGFTQNDRHPYILSDQLARGLAKETFI